METTFWSINYAPIRNYRLRYSNFLETQTQTSADHVV